MSAQITGFGKPLITDITLEWFLASVSSHVDFESARSHEALITALCCALEWSLTCVASEVIGQVAMSRELASTARICTLKGLLSVMNTLMRLQIALLCEAFVTAWEVTFEGLLPDVCPFMDLQTSCTRVALAADVAGEGLVTRVNELVGFQVSFGDETLIAALESADEGPFASLYICKT